MKLISWNVNGLRACVKKGFLDYFKEVDADIFCIQESKLTRRTNRFRIRRILCNIGIMQRKKDIQVQQYLQKKNL